MSYSPNYSTAISYDAANRLRVGQLTSLGDLKTLNADDTTLMETVGTGTALWGANKMQLTVAAGQYEIRRSRQYFPYFSGKSQQIEITQDGFQTEAGVAKMSGYFSSSPIAPYNTVYDGFALVDDGVTKRLMCWRAGTETLNVPMADWNGDSYLQTTYDWSNFTVLEFDFLWLGGAGIRLFVKTDRGFLLAHTHSHAGTSPDVFVLSPNQTVRWELRSTVGAGTFRPICAQAASEGSVDIGGKQRSINTGHIAHVLTTLGTTYPLLGLRKKATHRDRYIKMTGLSSFITSNTDYILVTAQLNPTLSAPLNWASIPESAGEVGLPVRTGPAGNPTVYTTTATVTSPGLELFSIILAQNTPMPPNILERDFLSSLGMSITNVSDQIVLCAQCISATVNIHATLNFIEY